MIYCSWSDVDDVVCVLLLCCVVCIFVMFFVLLGSWFELVDDVLWFILFFCEDLFYVYLFVDEFEVFICYMLECVGLSQWFILIWFVVVIGVVQDDGFVWKGVLDEIVVMFLLIVQFVVFLYGIVFDFIFEIVWEWEFWVVFDGLF